MEEGSVVGETRESGGREGTVVGETRESGGREGTMVGETRKSGGREGTVVGETGLIEGSIPGLEFDSETENDTDLGSGRPPRNAK